MPVLTHLPRKGRYSSVLAGSSMIPRALGLQRSCSVVGVLDFLNCSKKARTLKNAARTPHGDNSSYLFYLYNIGYNFQCKKARNLVCRRECPLSVQCKVKVTQIAWPVVIITVIQKVVKV